MYAAIKLIGARRRDIGCSEEGCPRVGRAVVTVVEWKEGGDSDDARARVWGRSVDRHLLSNLI